VGIRDQFGDNIRIVQPAEVMDKPGLVAADPTIEHG